MTTPTADHLEIARRTGYAGVEVRAERLLEAPRELAAAQAEVRPGEVWSLNGIQLKLTSHGDLRRDVLDEELPPRVEICRALGAGYLLVVPPRAAGVPVSAAIRAMQDGLAIVRDTMARVRAGVAFEFLGFADCPIDSPSRAGAVVDGLDSVDLVLDSCHWHASGGASLESFPVERLRMVHLNDAPPKPPRSIEDADRLLPTLGVIELRRLIGELAARGYAGPWSVETFNPAYWERDPTEIARLAFQLTAPLLETRLTALKADAGRCA